MVRIGVNLPIRPEPDAAEPSRFLSTGAALIEELGFDGAWMFDALGRGFATPEPLMALAVAANATTTIELGTCVLQLPLRPPVELAHRILTLDVLAGGRFVLGVGAGSSAGDFAAVDKDFEARFRLLDQSLREITTVLAGEPVRGISLTQWQFRTPTPQILIGAWSKGRWMARAATEFSGWIASAGKTDWATLEHGIARFRELGGARAVVVNVPVRIRDEDIGEDSPALVGTPDTIRQRWRRLLDLGFDDIVIAPRSHSRGELTRIRELLENEPPRLTPTT